MLWYRRAVKVQKVICLNYFIFRHFSLLNFSHIQPHRRLTSIVHNCLLQRNLKTTRMVASNSTYDWLEDVSGEKSMTWVKDHNSRTLKDKNIEESEPYQRTLAILDSKEKIPGISKIGLFWYNFWQDDNHVRGIWRRK